MRRLERPPETSSLLAFIGLSWQDREVNWIITTKPKGSNPEQVGIYENFERQMMGNLDGVKVGVGGELGGELLRTPDHRVDLKQRFALSLGPNGKR